MCEGAALWVDVRDERHHLLQAVAVVLGDLAERLELCLSILQCSEDVFFPREFNEFLYFESEQNILVCERAGECLRHCLHGVVEVTFEHRA